MRWRATFSQYFILKPKKTNFCVVLETVRTARLQSFDWDEINMDVENQGGGDVQGKCVSVYRQNSYITHLVNF